MFSDVVKECQKMTSDARDINRVLIEEHANTLALQKQQEKTIAELRLALNLVGDDSDCEKGC